jgi:hypothetical protein
MTLTAWDGNIPTAAGGRVQRTRSIIVELKINVNINHGVAIVQRHRALATCQEPIARVRKILLNVGDVGLRKGIAPLSFSHENISAYLRDLAGLALGT